MQKFQSLLDCRLQPRNRCQMILSFFEHYNVPEFQGWKVWKFLSITVSRDAHETKHRITR